MLHYGHFHLGLHSLPMYPLRTFWDNPLSTLCRFKCVLLIKSNIVFGPAHEILVSIPPTSSQGLGKILHQNLFCLLIQSGPQIRVRTGKYFSYFSTKTYVVGTQKNRLNETILLSTQNTCLN